MKIIMILTEALNLFKNLMNDLRGNEAWFIYWFLLLRWPLLPVLFFIFLIPISTQCLMGYGLPGLPWPCGFWRRSADLVFRAFAVGYADFVRIGSVLAVYSNIVSDAHWQKHWYVGAWCGDNSNGRPTVSRRKKIRFSTSWPGYTNAWTHWKNSCHQVPAKVVNNFMRSQYFGFMNTGCWTFQGII